MEKQAAIGLVLLLAACSSSGGGALDCETLKGDNCWKAALDEVRGCGGQTGDGGSVPTGTLSADGLTCTYPDGREVIFDAPLSLSLPPSYKDLGFTVKVSGKTCFSFKLTAGPPSAYALTVSSGTVRFEGVQPDEAVLTCPDGAVYRGNYYLLLDCGSTFQEKSEILPGVIWQGTSGSGGIELPGAGPDGPVTLFHCAN